MSKKLDQTYQYPDQKYQYHYPDQKKHIFLSKNIQLINVGIVVI